MPKLSDLMARGEAAGGMMREPGGMDPGAGGPPPPPDVGGGSTDIEGALGQLEGVVQGLGPDVAEQVMQHVNAIREIVSGASPDEGANEQPGLEPAAEPGADAGPQPPTEKPTLGGLM